MSTRPSAFLTCASMTWPSLKKELIRLLDRPGRRFLLGAAGTITLRRLSHEDISVSYLAGLWTRRIGPFFFPHGRHFEGVCSHFESWKEQIAQRDATAREFWLRYYTPGEGDVIVDVGAGRGEDVLTFSQSVGKTGRVIAIEADPLSFLFLRNFCRLNRLDNTTVLHIAAMDKPGRIYVSQSSSTWTENSVQVGDAEAGVAVAADTIDMICDKLDVREIAFLKMNIEGAERYALQGIARMAPKICHACVACHDFRAQQGDGEEFRTRAYVEECLVRHGFTLASRPDDPRDYVRDHIFALRPSRIG